MTATVLLHQPRSNQWLLFREPVEIVEAHRLDQVCEAIAHLDHQVQTRGLQAAGFLSYEASPAFDNALTVQTGQRQSGQRQSGQPDFPLLWFGLYADPQVLSETELISQSLANLGIANLGLENIGLENIGIAASTGDDRNDYHLEQWQASVSPAEFNQAIAAIKQAIAQGDTFQVNYTFRLRAAFQGNPWGLFLDLMKAQPGNYAAFVDTGDHVICSASPELFFTREGTRLTTRPMKGTTERGKWWQSDRDQAQALQASSKNRAENVMIVDMLRNDLGRIAQRGSVQVPSLFDVEQYPTLWQMTSTVTAESEASMLEIFQALFPCASITGAPKASTMGIIQSLECSPRNIYTGSIGYWGPGQQAQFNVAIRTVLIDQKTQQTEYGVGSGIVWDSESDAEYEECCLKTAILTPPSPRFELFETLLWEQDNGYFLVENHLQRLTRSAEYFGFNFAPRLAQQQLLNLVEQFEPQETAYRVKLLCDRHGELSLHHSPWHFTSPPAPLRVRLAPTSTDSTNPLLYHKTTQRQIYEQARSRYNDCDDVVLWNERGEVMESCIANLVVPWEGQLLTPPITSGLLPGTFRAWLLEQETIVEQVVTLEMLHQVSEFYLINSLRRWQRAQLMAQD